MWFYAGEPDDREHDNYAKHGRRQGSQRPDSDYQQSYTHHQHDAHMQMAPPPPPPPFPPRQAYPQPLPPSSMQPSQSLVHPAHVANWCQLRLEQDIAAEEAAQQFDLQSAMRMRAQGIARLRAQQRFMPFF